MGSFLILLAYLVLISQPPNSPSLPLFVTPVFDSCIMSSLPSGPFFFWWLVVRGVSRLGSLGWGRGTFRLE